MPSIYRLLGDTVDVCWHGKSQESLGVLSIVMLRDRHFDGSGPLGFVGKKGALIGVGIDCTGTFCEGSPG